MPDRDTVTHGSPSTYGNHACRCDACKAAHAAARRAYRTSNPVKAQEAEARARRRLRGRVEAGDPTVRHGSVATYNAGCRCDDCGPVGRAAATERQRRHRERKRSMSQMEPDHRGGGR